MKFFKKIFFVFLVSCCLFFVLKLLYKEEIRLIVNELGPIDNEGIKVCNILKKISVNRSKSDYLIDQLEDYFDSQSGQFLDKHVYNQVYLHNINSMFIPPVFDIEKLGLPYEISYLVSISEKTGDKYFDKFGIWVRKSYLVFTVSIENNSLKLDSGSGLVACDAAEDIFGPRS